MARRVDDNVGIARNHEGIVEDDELFNDDSFLAAVSQVEAQHLGRLSSVLSSNGSGIRGGQMCGRGLDTNIGEKRTVQLGESHVQRGSGQPLRGEDSASRAYADNDSRKRIRIQDDIKINLPANSYGQGQEVRLGSSGQSQCQQPEGEYMAALRGSNSELWQSSGVGRGIATVVGGLSNRGGASGNAVSGGNFRGGSSGTCYKCGMEGHWAKECTGGKAVSSPSKQIGRDVQGPSNVQERLCPCGAGTCLILTANTEKNQGRSFYRCPLRKDEGQCSFFEWCDAGGQSTPSEKANFSDFGQQPQLQCICGGGPCTTLTAKTEKNMGRQFYKCPLPQGCSFFQWCDVVQDGGGNGSSSSSTPNRAASYSGNIASPTPASGGCYKCGQEGHWSRDCQNQQPQYPSSFGGQSQAYNAGGSAEGKTTGNCYKCGGEGHWSNSCPNTGTPVGQKYAKPAGRGSGSGPSCFKCGDPGHWANRCPIAPSGQR